MITYKKENSIEKKSFYIMINEIRKNVAELISADEGFSVLSAEEVKREYLRLVALQVSKLLPYFIEQQCLKSPYDSQYNKLYTYLRG